MQAQDFAHIRAQFPQLAGFSDGFIRAMQMPLLLGLMQSQQAQHSSTQPNPRDADPGIRMARNLEALQQAPAQVQAGPDDRSTTVHPARYLGGPIHSAAKAWLQARDILGLDGLTPLCQYDMSAIGLGGRVTSQGWLELHNPASTRLAIKMFHSVNVRTTAANAKNFSLNDGGSSLSITEGLEEVAHLADLRTAVRVICKAAQYVMPWNQAFNALEGAMISAQWFQQDLGNRNNTAPILAEFINHVFSLNAAAWQQREPFLSAQDIRLKWMDWASGNSLVSNPFRQGGHISSQQRKNTTSQPQPSHQRQFGQKQHGGGGIRPPKQQPQAMSTKPATAVAVSTCHRYNAGSCKNADGACTTRAGKQLLHRCDAITSSGHPCGKKHLKTAHK
jgi:hypothetical protein